MKRTAVLAAAVAAAAVLVPAPAQAAVPGTVWIEGTTVRYLAAPGATNRVDVSPASDPGVIVVFDGLSPLAAAYPCLPVDQNTVRCPTAGITRLRVELGDGNDVASTATSIVAHVYGQAGADKLLAGGTAVEYLHGGLDNDTLLTGTGPGDVLYGDAGVDTASFQSRAKPVRVTLDNVANDGDVASHENDNVDTSVEKVLGGSANDELVGSALANILDGGSGNDTLWGANGNDTLVGGLGADTFHGNNGVDLVSYAMRTNPVTVRIDGLRGDGEAGENDAVLSTVEGVSGGAGADYLVGTAAANLLHGNAGADRVYGLGGNDYLTGGTANDYLNGGADSDTCVGGTGTNTLVSCP